MPQVIEVQKDNFTISTDPARLLPTVRSRCQALALPAPDAAQATHWLERSGLEGAADLLAAAVASVRAQVYPGWELCIADDCSTDLRLRGAPVFRTLVGPMPEGRNIIRYETPEVFESLTISATSSNG